MSKHSSAPDTALAEPVFTRRPVRATIAERTKPRAPRWDRGDARPTDVSVVVPVCNERKNLPALIDRVLKAMEQSDLTFELLFVNDHSDDGSAEYLESLEKDRRIRLLNNENSPGKAASLRTGFDRARGESIVMIDADLQYPPEAIPSMLDALETNDIVVANRRKRKDTRLRSALSKVFRFAFGRALLSLRVDVQSGLKAFRTDVIRTMAPENPTPWGFDYEFLYRARRMGCRIGEIDIRFDERLHGKSHVSPLQTGAELIGGAVKLRSKSLVFDALPFLHYPHRSEYRNPGFENTTDYQFLAEIFSCKRHIYAETVSLAIAALLGIVGFVAAVSALTGLPAALIVSAAIAATYLSLIVFKMRMVLSSLTYSHATNIKKSELRDLKDDDLPFYTILIPLYKEAPVIPQIMESMLSIDYPREKLEILITLEEYDEETREAIRAVRPPPHVRTIILPDVAPKTKPKALNVAFLEARGEFLVIYDAEILPEPQQLKKAVIAFRKRPEIACFQTTLDHYNARQNWITKLFNAEFSFHYDLFLPGLQRAGHALPLSGHSAHFRREALERIGAWDPYNLTEDCDIGIRLARMGYATDTMSSGSKEEATSTLRSWIAQRSRWMKGFMQTSIVHLRHPLRLKNELGGWGKFFGFLFLVPGSVLMNVVNLFYWALLGTWLVTHSTAIQALFPAPILYVSLFSFAVGNFLFMYLNLIGSYRRGRYGLVKYGLLSSVYWLMLGYAAVRAIAHLIVKPYQWEKTEHGSHLLKSAYVTPSFGN